jgi:hypothetical protein
LRRERDHELGDAGHHGTGQRHRRRGNAGRIASSIAVGLLTGRPPRARVNSKTLFIKPYLMVRPVFRAMFFSKRPTAFAPGRGVQMAAERTAPATS